MNKNKSIGQKIKERRTQLGLTAESIAKKIGVGKQEIYRLENISTRPSAEMLLKVSEALETQMLYFLTDCEANDVDEEVLLTKFRKLDYKNKKLVIKFVKILMEVE